MAGNIKLQTSAGGGVILDTATTTATDVTVKVPVTGVNNGTLVCSDSSGNVGIGTSSPAYKLEVVGQGRVSSYLTVGGVAADSGSAILFKAGSGSEAMRIDSSGKVLVNSSSANANLASGGLQITAADTPCIIQLTSATGQAMRFYSSTSTQAGYITLNGATAAYNSASDYRMKENIQPMVGALEKVMTLNPVTYDWKKEFQGTKIHAQGFIAHELQAIVPDCVTGEKDAVDAEGKPVYQGIDTSFLVATLTKAIQEQQAQIETLTAKVAALEVK